MDHGAAGPGQEAARPLAGGGRPQGATAPADELVRRLRTHLADDLDTPAALAAVDDWAGTGGADRDAPRLARAAVDALLGVRL